MCLKKRGYTDKFHWIALHLGRNRCVSNVSLFYISTQFTPCAMELDSAPASIYIILTYTQTYRTMHPCIFPHKTANIQRKCGRRRCCCCNFLLLFFTSFNYSCACSFRTWTLGCCPKGDGWCVRFSMHGRLLFLVFLCNIFDGFIRISMFTFLESEFNLLYLILHNFFYAQCIYIYICFLFFSVLFCLHRFTNTANYWTSNWYNCTSSWSGHIEL